MPNNCCEPPTTTTNIYDYEIPSSQFLSEAVTVAGNTATLANVPISDACVMLFVNGVFQKQSIDYTILGAVITFMSAPASGSVVVANYIKAT